MTVHCLKNFETHHICLLSFRKTGINAKLRQSIQTQLIVGIKGENKESSLKNTVYNNYNHR